MAFTVRTFLQAAVLPAGSWVESSAKEGAPQILRYLSGRTSSVKDGKCPRIDGSAVSKASR
jgi:hypothetical protein